MNAISPDELRAVLARAAEIHSATQSGYGDLETIMQAAEEVGIPRVAVERALRERSVLPAKAPEVGQLVFASSTDEKLYVAEVVAIEGAELRVRFLRGGEHTVSPDQLRPCALLPGERVVCYWPWWGPWTCTVVSHEAGQRYVTVSDGWGETRTFPLSEIWLSGKRPTAARRRRVYAALIGMGATAGAAIGALITALLLR